jgi:hypothetical protein
MLAVFWPPHVGADVFRRNVLGTVEPLIGEVTPMSLPTVMAMFFSQKVPFPHDLTWRVCVPRDALTFVLMDVAGLKIVSVPLSMEYPILAVGWDKQVLEVAFRTNGDGTTAPLAGAVTEISAARAEPVSNAMLEKKSNKVQRERDGKSFIRVSFQDSMSVVIGGVVVDPGGELIDGCPNASECWSEYSENREHTRVTETMRRVGRKQTGLVA